MIVKLSTNESPMNDVFVNKFFNNMGYWGIFIKSVLAYFPCNQKNMIYRIREQFSAVYKKDWHIAVKLFIM